MTLIKFYFLLPVLEYEFFESGFIYSSAILDSPKLLN